MTHLYLIRHGEATTQVHNFLRDDGLTPLGITQAERLRDRLAATREIVADVLISSTLPRARQTAQIIAPALNLPIILDDDVQELRIGEAEGMSIDEFKDKYGIPTFEEEPFRPVSPGGENWGQFVLRVATALARITEEHEEKSIVVVCHGGVVDCSFLYFAGLGTLRFPPIRFHTYNTSVTHWHKGTENDLPAHWQLIRYNDDLHVRDIHAPGRILWETLRVPQEPETVTNSPAVPPSEQ